ncbi:hypothetical protein SAMN04488005_1489 [Yoonia tamlensis]|uniref:Uncharacterized protein n=1 Tax=Yoonia tamlensis TaxID=390270 RepID=A0A1I6GDZ9_9RHOB|nr:hypothetical protein [Yoonia tamlensis]SFR40378.1 hypothetical protein SAMN04488005_1489 [Yoonia tamlensis]
MIFQSAVTAVAMCLPVGATGRPDIPYIIPDDERPGIAAPFAEKPSISISVENAIQLLRRQKMLSVSSSDGVRVSFTSTISNGVGFAEQRPSEQIAELKRLSGLTWAQISNVFGVNSRTLHYWKCGERVSAENHQKLGAAIAMLRFVDRGTAEENRRLLLSEASEGRTFLDLMKHAEFRSIRDIAGKGVGRVSFGKVLTNEARLKNAPQSFMPSAEIAQLNEVELLQRPQTRRKNIRREKA